MSVFPNPRNIRRNWKKRPTTPEEARAIIDRVKLAYTTDDIVEARRWTVTRGHERGRMKRLDVAFSTERQMSIRFNRGQTIVRYGVGACQ